MPLSTAYIAYIVEGRDLGHGTWRDRKRAYWTSRWTRKHCLICWRRRRLQLHHVSYAHLGHERDYELRPLCAWPCHPIVTMTSRTLRRMAIKHSIVIATYGLWLLSRLALVAFILRVT